MKCGHVDTRFTVCCPEHVKKSREGDDINKWRLLFVKRDDRFCVDFGCLTKLFEESQRESQEQFEMRLEMEIARNVGDV